MKLKHAIHALSIMAAVLGNPCRADLNGRDDFNDNSKDTNRWGADVVARGIGVFTETNRRLEYTAAGNPISNDLVVRPWVLNFGSYTQDWSVQLDVSVPSFAFTNVDQQVFIGLVANDGSSKNRFLIEFGQGNMDRHFRSFYAANNVQMTNFYAATASLYGAVRLAFDSSSKTLSCFYDANGPDCGYSWTLLRTENVGTGWGLSNASTIVISVIGDSELTPIVSGDNVFADNFRASSGSTPALRIARANGNAIISWSTNGPAVYLESASTLTPPVCWQVVTNIPAIVNTNSTVTNASSSGNRFYRLSR